MSEIFHKTFTQECGKAEVQPIDFDKNGDIILKVVKEYRTKNFLANITRMPIIKSFLSTGYRVITLNKHYMLGPENRILWLKVVVVCGLIAGLLLSLRLWTFERFFPLAPLLDNFPVVPPLINLFFFILLIGALLAILLNPKPQKLIFLAVFIATFFAVFDQMRWQPWFYQYVFMLATIGLYSWDSYDKNKCIQDI